MLLVPMLYIFIFGSAFRFESDPSKNKAYLGVLDKDGGFLSHLLIAGIQSQNILIDTLAEEPKEPPTRMLIIPDSFTVRSLKGEETTLEIVKQQGSNVEAEMAAKMAVRKSYMRLIADLVELKINDQPIDAAHIERLENREPLIKVSSRYAGKHKIIPGGFNQQVPANIVMFTLLIIFLAVGGMIIDEKRSGIIRRINVAPVSFGQLYAGKLAGATLIGVAQIGLLALIGRFVFGVYYGPSPPAFLLLALLFAASVAAIGLTLGMVVQSEEKIIAIGILLAITMSAISGCWWPVEISPPWMATIASLLPSGIALSGFHQLISYGRGVAAILPHLVKLALYTLVFAVIFARLLAAFDSARH